MMELAKLKEPFHPDRVSWRVGSTNADKTRGMALAYIDARDVQDRLDAVCKPENWQCRYALLGTTTVCEVGIKVVDEWVWKADGAGETDYEAQKGALSDAFKRAAVKWGIGRYLYDLDSPWVPIEARGKTFHITDAGKAILREVLNKASSVSGTPKERAIEWANAALIELPKMTPTAFSAWHKANSDKVAAIKKCDETLHIQLIAAITAKQNQFHPLNA